MTALALLGWYGAVLVIVAAVIILPALFGHDITAGRPPPRA